jgi:nucleotide-binding universal stress UspA family protein
MICVEGTIIYEKHHAVVFACSVLAFGLTARGIAKIIEKQSKPVVEHMGINVLSLDEARDLMPLYKGTVLVALKMVGPRIIEEAAIHAQNKGETTIYVLYVEHKPAGWAYPEEAEPSYESVNVLKKAEWEFSKRGILAVPLWSMSDDPAAVILKASNELNLSTIVIGSSHRGAIERLARGEVLKKIADQLSADKKLIICN